MERLREEAAAPVEGDLLQTLGELGIDEAFVVPLEHRPVRSKGSASSIPVIDLGALQQRNQQQQQQDIAREVGAASRQWGFFQVINHGVPLQLLDNLELHARRFFDLPLEQKLKVRRSDVRPTGFYESELTKNTRDWKQVFDFGAREKVQIPEEYNLVIENQWPEEPTELKSACREWIEAIRGLSYKILELLAISLDLSPTYFHQFFGDEETSMVRLNFYMKCPVPDLVLGVSRHRDQGPLTVLVQDEVGGLEVQRSDGKWIRVEPRRDAFVINLGDLMEVWSNGLYKSVEHRVVVNENRDRFSCPYFLFPSYKSEIAPVSALTSADNPPKYRPFIWGEFDKNRKDSNFKRLGVENLQVHHYAIR